MTTTHICRICETAVEVGRVDVTTVTSGPSFVWGRWERCTGCGSTAAPLEVVDANDRQTRRITTTLYAKLDATTAAEAVAIAYRRGLLGDGPGDDALRLWQAAGWRLALVPTWRST